MHPSIDTETAIIVLKNLQDWLYFSSINGGTKIQREAIEMAIEALETESHWTPCNERLPKAKQKVLVQYADGSMATKRCNDEGHLAWFYSNVVAWMPAPEEYKGVTE